MKTTLTLLLTLALTVLLFTTGMGATLKCEVSRVEGTTVVLDCGEKADKLAAGVTVKVKTEAVKQAIEGC